MHDFKYSELIDKIKKRRRWVIAIMVVALIVIALFSGTTYIEVMGEPIIKHGLHPVAAILLFLLCFALAVIAYSAVSLPLFSSMDQECDPEKQLILNMHLNKTADADAIFSSDYLYLGMYIEAMNCAKKLVATGKEPLVLTGLFCKARCEFLMGDFAAFGQTASDYTATLSTCKKLKAKQLEAHQKIGEVLRLMFAISSGDSATVNELRGRIEPWTPSAATEGYINYVKGLAAAQIGDKDEAVYRFKSVKERCSKTVFATLSDQHLASLSEQSK